ncbi:MAG TPA: pyrroloquinoline quinone-dependent dehydrogenase [Blastocatellia bacterium]|nr:pyrroloquinoline quinone-dependent dehydrogenase [Blastocatellia bacterium]
MRGLRQAVVCVCCVMMVGSATTTMYAQLGATKGEWRFYGGDTGSSKYSPLTQINKDNAGKLKAAWSWDSPDIPLQQKNRMFSSLVGYEATPVMVNGVLYVSTSLCQVAAINAQTGSTIWVYDPQSYNSGRPTNLGFLHRGVAYWTDGNQERVFIGTGDAYLIALDAKIGKPVTDFGDQGKINLAKAIPLAVNARNYAVSSPPLVCRDVVIVGSSINDGPINKEAPRGDVQAFDARTGKPAWIFHTVPQAGEFGVETWKNDSWKYTGNTNSWTLLSADEELGYVYIPTGTPTNDWYGGHRLGDNLFAESLICLEAKTGKRVWHFQSVHHGLWDYDFPAAPVLCNITVGGRRIRAVAQISKTGFCFVFDRVTGKPVWPIEERPVTQSIVPGEKSSATQPFPTKPAPFERQGSIEDNLIDFTPELRQEALKILNQYDHGPIFTPPSEKGTINLPGWGGGGNWWGAAADPDTGVLYIPSITAPIVVKLVKPDPARSNFDYVRGGTALGGIDGPQGLPLFKPPYGRITAINLNTGDHTWQIPLGDGPREQISKIAGKDVGPLGAGGGGPLLTKTLLFVGQGAAGRGGSQGGGANLLRAFDKATGKLVADIELPGRPSGTPMTYMAGGKQFIVIATADNRLVALSLP